MVCVAVKFQMFGLCGVQIRASRCFSLKEVAQQLHYTHCYANLMMSHYTTLVPSLGLHIRSARAYKGAYADPQQKEKERHI